MVAHADVGTVVALLGTNDLLGHRSIGDREMVDGFRQLVTRAHAAGVRADPSRVQEEHAWFGGLHPNALGHRAMAEAVDLSQLAPASAPG